MTEPELIAFLEDNGYYNIRKINGHFCGLSKFAFTTAIVVKLTEDGYDMRYCYENAADAEAAFENWNGIQYPPGPWIKRKGVGGDLLNPRLFNEFS